ncbi:MAG: glycosyltransferase [Caldilineae bacterium]|nr:MAG: glycosyltransferase [Caldilineae bacterium]
MRITFLLSSLQLSGGEMLVMEYANRLADKGHQVTLVAPAGSVHPEQRAALRASISVRESQRARPETPTPFGLAALTLSLARAIPPSDFLVATHTPTLAPAWLGSRLLRRGRLIWLFMDYPEMFRGRPVEGTLLRLGPRLVDGIAAISAPLAEAASSRARCPVVRSGAGLPRRHLLYPPSTPQPAPPKRIFYVGDARPRKGLVDFLAAADVVHRQHPDILLVIASKTPCSLSTAAPVEFHLRPTDAELADLYRSSHLFVSASWGEGLGYPPLEAMACGVPVVLTDSSGVRDYAVDGENCLMVPPHAPQALAAAMLRLLHESGLAARLVEGGLATAARYRWDDAADAFEELLKRSSF